MLHELDEFSTDADWPAHWYKKKRLDEVVDGLYRSSGPSSSVTAQWKRWRASGHIKTKHDMRSHVIRLKFRHLKKPFQKGGSEGAREEAEVALEEGGSKDGKGGQGQHEGGSVRQVGREAEEGLAKDQSVSAGVDVASMHRDLVREFEAAVARVQQDCPSGSRQACVPPVTPVAHRLRKRSAGHARLSPTVCGDASASPATAAKWPCKRA